MIALVISLSNKFFHSTHTTPAPVIEPDPAPVEWVYSEMWGMKFHVTELEFAGECQGVARYHVHFGGEFTGMVVYEDQMWAA